MPEFRQNLASKEWVILAPERGRRPSDNSKSTEMKEDLPPHRDDCPFCPGNENLTDSSVYTLPENGRWLMRVVPNKFAALQSNLSTARSYVGRF
jgi:UDPglucose--hexose-1-phosphate uridylyltransferase